MNTIKDFKAKHRKKYTGLYYSEVSKCPPQVDTDFLKRKFLLKKGNE
ncbi:MAG: hypothetical protein HY754_07015 [Nitrospirae bacterium]|nr:hypothetical protein [Nitrospirota bacterium]